MESSLHNNFRPKLKGFAKGYLEGVRQVYRSKEFTLRVLQKYTRVTDPEVLSQSYDKAYQAIDKAGSLTDAGIQAQLADLVKTDPHAKNARPSDFFDGSIIDGCTRKGLLKPSGQANKSVLNTGVRLGIVRRIAAACAALRSGARLDHRRHSCIGNFLLVERKSSIERICSIANVFQLGHSAARPGGCLIDILQAGYGSSLRFRDADARTLH